ncbi:autoinducer binding domain-containing protein [Bradyrhizobium sp.]|uniref:autoinducer binding domain-containing protein n=1 Tax=Bradyrhizobium sp. TaxID=376 RepID=UPI003C18244F
MEIFRFIELSNQTKSPELIFELLVEATSSEGFDRVAYGSVNYRESLRLADYNPQAIMLNYPIEWQKSYFERKDHEIDPILLFSPQMARSFRWNGFAERGLINKRQRAFFGMAEDAGLRNGVSVPIHGAGGKISVLSFASSAAGTDESAKQRHLEVLASQFHIAFLDLSNDDPMDDDVVLMSDRERDCLSWTAQGKSSWDIGAILNISENTVNFHIKNAMRKLDTSSRTVAVIKAIRQGIIDLPSRSRIR